MAAAADEVLTGRPLPGGALDVSRNHHKGLKNRPYLQQARLVAGLARNLLSRVQTISTAAEKDVVIYMDDYRQAQAIDMAAHRRYDEELLCANWNPAVRVLALSWYQNNQELSPELPEDFSKIDANAFLNRVYALATQV